MGFQITDATTRAAWLAAGSQRAQLEALASPWAGGPVTVRYFAGGTLLRTQTLPALAINSAAQPFRITLGAVSTDTHAATGTPDRMVLRAGSTDVVEMSCSVGGGSGDVDFAGPFKALCTPTVTGVSLLADDALMPEWSSVAVVSEDANVPFTTADQTPVLQLHESGAGNLTTGRQYRAQVIGLQAYDVHTEFAFSTVRGTAALGKDITLIRPVDGYGTYPSAVRRESFWMGFTNAPDAPVRLITERRVRDLLRWSKGSLPNLNWNRLCLIGGSMGAWGCATLGPAIEDELAAIYASRPRVRYNNFASATVSVPNWPTGATSYAVASAPALSADDGGGSVAAKMDFVAYVANAANPLPWIGFCLGRNDGFAPFEDFIALVAALRATGRGFACVWNDGNHTVGNIISQITASYPYGTFDSTKGYPVFTNHSGDADPAVDVSGGINEGLSFRNVVESAGAWSCEVTSILGARTVDVRPRSAVFTASVSAQTINIPAANTWMPVTFTV